MFQLHREMDRLDLPSGEIFQLQRSLNRVQVGLPGFPSQEAEAYLCLMAAGQGVRAAIVLHLQVSQRLAVYLNDPGPVPTSRATRLLDEGIAFAESMGFMLGDLDFPILSDKEKNVLWESLPLRKGLQPVPEPGPEKKAPAAPPADKRVPPVASDAIPSPKAPAPTGSSEQRVPPTSAPPAPPIPETHPEVPLPRTLRAPKRAPTPQEIAGKRLQLRETLGKLLASL